MNRKKRKALKMLRRRLMRPNCHLASPETGVALKETMRAVYNRYSSGPMPKLTEIAPNIYAVVRKPR